MLVLTPTRELALQVTTATDKYSAYSRRLKPVSILGGMPYPKQMQLLSRNPEILVAIRSFDRPHGIGQRSISPAANFGARRNRSHARYGLYR